MKVGRCKNGHAMIPENTYVVPATGQVMCRTCNRGACRRRRERLREELDAIKRRRGCIDCGRKDGPLHFDHRPGEIKLYTIGDLRGSRKALLAETKKCDVRCDSCHSKRHGLERGAWEVRGDLLCWHWTGYCNHEGTPMIRTKDSQTTARRYYYEREKGPIPEGLILYALCRNPKCVRVHHMQAITWAEWNRRKGMTVLSPQLAARALLMRHNGLSRREVARRLEVSEPTIKEVEDGTHWTVRKEGRNGTAPARLAGGSA